MESLYNHFSHPTKNKALISMQKKLGVKVLKINSLSDTRWNCRMKNCESVLENYEAIVAVLQEEIDNQLDRNVSEAIGIIIVFKLLLLSIIYLIRSNTDLILLN